MLMTISLLSSWAWDPSHSLSITSSNNSLARLLGVKVGTKYTLYRADSLSGGGKNEKYVLDCVMCLSRSGHNVCWAMAASLSSAELAWSGLREACAVLGHSHSAIQFHRAFQCNTNKHSMPKNRS